MLGFGTIGQFAIGQVGAGQVEIITPDKWFVALSEPVRVKQGLQAPNQAAHFFNVNPFVSFSWFGNLSEPVRRKPINPASLPQLFFMQPAPSPFVATGWFNWLSEPVRIKSGLRPEQQQFLAYQANTITVTPFAWFSWLSEPVRIKAGLKAYLQKVETQDTRWIPAPATLIEGWFNWLSEPKRFQKGLGAPYQLDYASHPRVLPPPNVTATINTIEINGDIPLIAVNVVKSNPPATANVSIVEIGNGLSATSVIESS